MKLLKIDDVIYNIEKYEKVELIDSGIIFTRGVSQTRGITGTISVANEYVVPVPKMSRKMAKTVYDWLNTDITLLDLDYA